MIELKTSCCECVHKDVCKFEYEAEKAAEKLKKAFFPLGENSLEDWESYSNNNKFNINFECTLFRKYENMFNRH